MSRFVKKLFFISILLSAVSLNGCVSSGASNRTGFQNYDKDVSYSETIENSENVEIGVSDLSYKNQDISDEKVVSQTNEESVEAAAEDIDISFSYNYPAGTSLVNVYSSIARDFGKNIKFSADIPPDAVLSQPFEGEYKTFENASLVLADQNKLLFRVRNNEYIVSKRNVITADYYIGDFSPSAKAKVLETCGYLKEKFKVDIYYDEKTEIINVSGSDEFHKVVKGMINAAYMESVEERSKNMKINAIDSNAQSENDKVDVNITDGSKVDKSSYEVNQNAVAPPVQESSPDEDTGNSQDDENGDEEGEEENLGDDFDVIDALFIRDNDWVGVAERAISGKDMKDKHIVKNARTELNKIMHGDKQHSSAYALSKNANIGSMLPNMILGSSKHSYKAFLFFMRNLVDKTEK